ncbi:MAG: serine/threonine-protein kinase [Planctomycetota bacterium]|nr:serine/threonine-protein kinase [Planctomycetota bacterium]
MNPSPNLPLPKGFRRIRRLGGSALSEVHLVKDGDGEPFALKILLPSVARDSRILERWKREAILLSEIHHPNLVRSHGSLEIEGRPALLLEYIEGPNLRDRLRVGSLEWEQTARIGVQISRALEALHKHGAIHRDVKPHNILLHPRRGAVLADLGLVRRQEDPELTAPGAPLGSPAYMSPEQVQDPSSIGPSADVYSLAASLHHCLCGEPPFIGKGVAEVLHRVVHEAPSKLPEEVPEPFRKVMSLAMAKDPETRYPRAIDFRNDLSRVLTGFAPKLITHIRRRAQLRAFLGVCAASVLAFLGWTFWPKVNPESQRAIDVTELVSAKTSTDPATNPTTPVASPPLADWEEWASPFRTRFTRSLAHQELREAWATVLELKNAPIPVHADEPFLSARDAMIEQLEETLLLRAEDIAVQAEHILDQERKLFREHLKYRDFFQLPPPDTWKENVQKRWKDALLPVSELPLSPGGVSLERLLIASTASLEKEWNQRATRIVESRLPEFRLQMHKLIREKKWNDAWRMWGDFHPRFLVVSSIARRENKRMQELQSLSSQDIYETPLWKLDLNFEGEPGKREWLFAHLLWSRQEDGTALSHMRAAVASGLAGDWAPSEWLLEWSIPRGETAPNLDSEEKLPPQEVPEEEIRPVEQDSLGEMIARWQEADPSIEFQRSGQTATFSWKNPNWVGTWSRSLPWNSVWWEVEAWGIEWSLGLKERIPAFVHVFGVADLEKTSEVALPNLRVGEKANPGLGIVQGIAQSLVWEGGFLRLDGLQVAKVDFPTGGRRLKLKASAQPSFSLSNIWIRVRYSR